MHPVIRAAQRQQPDPASVVNFRMCLNERQRIEAELAKREVGTEEFRAAKAEHRALVLLCRRLGVHWELLAPETEQRKIPRPEKFLIRARIGPARRSLLGGQPSGDKSAAWARAGLLFESRQAGPSHIWPLPGGRFRGWAVTGTWRATLPGWTKTPCSP